MSRVRNADIRSELRPAARLMKLTFTASGAATFEKYDRQCVKKYRGKWKSRNTIAEEKAIVREDGTILRLLVVRCEEGTRAEATGLLWLHDGGFAFGVPEQESLLVDMFCGDGSCVAVLPDYTKSTESPYPYALEDCHKALLWMKNNAEELGINRSQLFVGGSGAGGGLTAALCLRARDVRDVNIAFQMPISPMLDDRMESESARDNNAPVWDSRKNRAAWDLYLQDMNEEIPVYAAPGREEDVHGLPAACSIVGDLEPVKDETVLYFTRMKKAGIPVSLRVYHGCFHNFENTAVNSNVALNAHRYLVDSFRYAQHHYFAHNKVAPPPEAFAESMRQPEAEQAPAEETTASIAEQAPAEETTASIAEQAPAEETTASIAEQAPVEEAAVPIAEQAPVEEAAEPISEQALAEEVTEAAATLAHTEDVEESATGQEAAE